MDKIFLWLRKHPYTAVVCSIVIVLFGIAIIVVGILGFWVDEFSPRVSWLSIISCMIIISWAIGYVVTTKIDEKNIEGRFLGLFIDNRKKMSLSRLQIVLWTILTLSTFATIGLYRTIPLIQNQFSSQSTTPDDGTLSQSEEEPQIIQETYNPLDITIPGELLLAMGISFFSFAGSALIKTNKATTENGQAVEIATNQLNRIEEAETALTSKLNLINNFKIARENLNNSQLSDTNVQAAEESQFKINLSVLEDKLKNAEAELKEAEPNLSKAINTNKDTIESALAVAEKKLEIASQQREDLSAALKQPQGELHVNESIDQANLGDLFRGDLVSNFRVVDLAKVQMFFFTIIIVFTYGTLIYGLLGNAEGLLQNTVELPAFSDSLNTLLLISHSGYLVTKQVG